MKVDMSAKAVTARLKLTSQLRRLCLSLGRARPVEAATDLAAKPALRLKNQPRSDATKSYNS